MISVAQMRSMCACLQEKVATRALGTSRDYEEMSAPRYKQWAKDLPIVAVGTGLGYAGGRALGDAAGKYFLQGSPKTRRALEVGAPLASSIASSMGAYALGRQSALQKQRRDEAEALTRFNNSVKQAGVT